MNILERIKCNIKSHGAIILMTYIPALLVIIANVSSGDISLAYAFEIIFCLVLGFVIACLWSLKNEGAMIYAPIVSFFITMLLDQQWGYLICFSVLSVVLFIGSRRGKRNRSTSRLNPTTK